MNGDVDLARYAQAFLRRSWIVVVCMIAGALIGFLVTRSASSHQAEARATLYLGTPITPQGTAIPSTLNANPATVSVIVGEGSVQRAAEQAAGLAAGALSGHVASAAIAASLATTSSGRANPIFEVTVQGPWSPRVVQRADQSLANQVVAVTSGYATAKTLATQAQITQLQRAITQITETTTQAQTKLAALAHQATPQASAQEAPLMGLVATNAGLVGSLTAALQTAQLNAIQAAQVEASRIVTVPLGRRIDTVARRSSLLAGFAAGLLLGILVCAATLVVRPPRATQP